MALDLLNDASPEEWDNAGKEWEQFSGEVEKTEAVESALDRQEGGDHYKNLSIQPAEYCQLNKIPCLESFIIKYATRWRAKGGVLDLNKIIHCVELIKKIESIKEE